jgi:hypothetical protein
VRESCTPDNRDYHITTRDIVRLHRIVENREIRYDDNDAISLQVWITQIQQDGGEVILKDKLDPSPPGSGLSPNVFVLCIQTKFQMDQFKKLGPNFVSIDATHNTNEYIGLNLFTVVVRDFWGHGTLCGAFPHSDTMESRSAQPIFRICGMGFQTPKSKSVSQINRALFPESWYH